MPELFNAAALMKFRLAHKLQWPDMHVLFKGLGFVSGFAVCLF